MLQQNKELTLPVPEELSSCKVKSRNIITGKKLLARRFSLENTREASETCTDRGKHEILVLVYL